MGGREHGHEGEQGAVAVELGSRLRNLRTTAGLTQTELAGGRFSKEYLSQIERGKTRPTTDTVAWLAERLGVDADLLLTGVSASERNRWEAQLARAEALSERYEFAAAAPEFAEARTLARAAGAKELELRALTGEGWARLQEGELKDAAALLDRGTDALRGRAVLRHRARRRPLPARRLPLPALEHLDRDRALRRSARARRTLPAAERPPSRADLPLALPLLPPAA